MFFENFYNISLIFVIFINIRIHKWKVIIFFKNELVYVFMKLLISIKDVYEVMIVFINLPSKLFFLHFLYWCFEFYNDFFNCCIFCINSLWLIFLRFLLRIFFFVFFILFCLFFLFILFLQFYNCKYWFVFFRIKTFII